MMSAVNCLFIFVIRVIHYRGNFVSHDFSAGLVSFGVFSLTIDVRAINCLFLILLGYRVGSNLYYFYKYETIIRRSYYYSLPSPSSLSVSVSNLYRHHQSLTASYLLESHIWLDSDSKNNI
jgi:hypothetical protein